MINFMNKGSKIFEFIIMENISIDLGKKEEKNGYLKLIIGPMFSGKTSQLIREVRRYRSIGKNVLCINHSINKRFGRDDIVSHDLVALDNNIITDKLCSIYEDSEMLKYNDADIIAIEELQFFPDAYDFVISSVEKDLKNVICCGLDGDFLRQPFGDVLRLIPICDKMERVSAFCSICANGTPGIFSKKISGGCKVVEVGAGDTYIPVCRKCYLRE